MSRTGLGMIQRESQFIECHCQCCWESPSRTGELGLEELSIEQFSYRFSCLQCEAVSSGDKVPMVRHSTHSLDLSPNGVALYSNFKEKRITVFFRLRLKERSLATVVRGGFGTFLVCMYDLHFWICYLRTVRVWRYMCCWSFGPVTHVGAARRVG